MSTSEILDVLKTTTSSKVAPFMFSIQVETLCGQIISQINSNVDGEVLMCVLYHVVDVLRDGHFFTLPMAYEAVHAWCIEYANRRYLELEIVQACGALFDFDGDSRIIRARSPLLEKYAAREALSTSENERSIIASIRYLSHSDSAGGACSSSVDLKRRFQVHGYLSHAPKHYLTFPRVSQISQNHCQTCVIF